MRISKAMKMMSSGAMATLVATTIMVTNARAHDFPTKDIVDYVEVCVRDDKNDRVRQELIYKCSCVMDALAGQYKYDQFVEGITAARAFGIAGERGSVIRDSQEVQAMASAFRKAEKTARKQCFLE